MPEMSWLFWTLIAFLFFESWGRALMLYRRGTLAQTSCSTDA